MKDAVALPFFLDGAGGVPAVLGIRPEAFAIRRDDTPPPGAATFDVVPELLEPMGADTLVTFTIGSRELRACLGGKERLDLREPLCLSCPTDSIRVFDPGTEAAVQGL